MVFFRQHPRGGSVHHFKCLVGICGALLPDLYRLLSASCLLLSVAVFFIKYMKMICAYIGLSYGDSSRRSFDNIGFSVRRSEEHTSELQSRFDLVCRLLLEKKKSQNLG